MSSQTSISSSSALFAGLVTLNTRNSSPIDSTRPSANSDRRATTKPMKIGKYLLEKTIGKGNFAVVKLASHCDTQQKVAIKIIDKSRVPIDDHHKLEREIMVMKSLIHPNIIRLYEVMESKNLIYLVTEYADQGALLDVLTCEKRFCEGKARDKFRQLLLAVEYIHSKNIVHRDLKAENLLVDSDGNLKVADFGFANTFGFNEKLKTFCGSPPYAAPELFQSLPYSPEKVDVWSLGVLLYIFVCGHLPFDSANAAELRRDVLSGQIRFPFYLSSDCIALISYMLNVNPDQRATIEEIKNHPWTMMSNVSPMCFTLPLPSLNNCPLTNAILDQAETFGYDRQQIIKSVHGHCYDSDAAIWYLLVEKCQKTSNNSETHHDQVTHPTDNHQLSIDKTCLTPLVSNFIPEHRRASDSSAYLHAQEQFLKTLDVHSPILALASTNTSRGSITRGEPILLLPTLTITSDDDEESLTRYLTSGKRHTVHEQINPFFNGKMTRRIRETLRDRNSFSRRASDISSSLMTNATRSHLERLYRHTISSHQSIDEEEDLSKSSLQELHQLQRQIQRSSIRNQPDSPVHRRSTVIASPNSNSLALHIIREEQQANPSIEWSSPNTSSSSSISTDEDEMDNDTRLSITDKSIDRHFFHQHHPIPFYHCHVNPMFTQQLRVPTAYLP